MKLYIVRHGLAGEHGDPCYPDDRLRPLTAEGRQRFAATAKALAAAGCTPQLVATSPLVRCRQTAEILVHQSAGQLKLIELPALEPGSDLPALIEWTNEQQGQDIAWVGHAPDVSNIAAQLLGCSRASIRFAKGAVMCLGFNRAVARGQGELHWHVTAKVLSC